MGQSLEISIFGQNTHSHTFQILENHSPPVYLGKCFGFLAPSTHINKQYTTLEPTEQPLRNMIESLIEILFLSGAINFLLS